MWFSDWPAAPNAQTAAAKPMTTASLPPARRARTTEIPALMTNATVPETASQPTTRLRATTGTLAAPEKPARAAPAAAGRALTAMMASSVTALKLATACPAACPDNRPWIVRDSTKVVPWAHATKARKRAKANRQTKVAYAMTPTFAPRTTNARAVPVADCPYATRFATPAPARGPVFRDAATPSPTPKVT